MADRASPQPHPHQDDTGSKDTPGGPGSDPLPGPPASPMRMCHRRVWLSSPSAALPLVLIAVSAAAALALATLDARQSRDSPGRTTSSTETDPGADAKLLERVLLERAGATWAVMLALHLVGFVGLCCLLSSRFRAWLLPPPRRAPRTLWTVVELLQGGALTYVLIVLVAQIPPRMTTGFVSRLASSLLPQLALGAPLLVLLLRARGARQGEPRRWTLSALGLSARSVRENLLRGATGYLVVLPVVTAAAIAAAAVGRLVGEPPRVHPLIQEVVDAGVAETAVLLAAAIIIAPAMEELFFRGFLYATIRDRWGVPAGIATSALLFAVVHPGLPNQAVTAVLGAALAALYERGGSLIAPVTAHALFNGVQLSLVLSATCGR